MPSSMRGGFLRDDATRALVVSGLGPSPYITEVLADNPTSYWRLNEASGAVAADEQGVNDGTYVNAPTLGAAGLAPYGGSAVSFAAADLQELTLPGPLLSTDGTIEFWFKWTSGIALGRDHTQASGWLLGYDASGSFHVRVAGSTEITTSLSTAQVRDGSPHHLVITKAGTSTLVYVDGVQVGSNATSASTAAVGPWHLGRNGAGAQYTDCVLDEVAIYPTALAADRVVAHYTAHSRVLPSVVSTSTGVAAPGTDVVITKPALLATGDLMVAAIVNRGSNGDTITPPAGWTVAEDQARGSVGRMVIFTKVATGSEPASYTFVCSANNTQAGAIVAVRDATTVDTAAGTTATVATGLHTCPTVTTTASKELVLRIVCTAVSTLPLSWTWPAGATEIVDFNSVATGAGGLSIATQPADAAGAVGTLDATFAQSSSTTYASATLALA